MTTRPGGPRARVRAAKTRERLSDRDLRVLELLNRLRLMTGRQIQRACVAEGSTRTRARRTRALLQRLHDLRLVVRLGRRVGGIRAGSAGYVWGLSGHGQAVLHPERDGRRRRVWETSPAFQDHVLAVAELHVQLIEAERRADDAAALELLSFDGEPACWRSFLGPHGQPVAVKPDAFVRLGVGADERYAFVEMDCGTESIPTISRKCQTYIRYWRSGGEQQETGVFPRAVWLVPNDRRRERLRQVIEQQPADSQQLFRVATHVDGPEILIHDTAHRREEAGS